MGGSFWIRIRLGKAVAGPGVRGQDDRDKWKQTSFFQGFRGGVWHPKCDHGRLVLDVRGQDDRDKWKQTFFSRDSEAAFGTQSATMGGWFWARIRLGKAVAGPGVRGQDDRDK